MRTATPRATWSRMTARGAVGDRGIDLDAAVDRARVHDDGVGLGERQPPRVEAEVARVLARVGEQARRPCARSGCAASSRRRRRRAPARCGRSTLGAHLARCRPASSVRGAATRTVAPSFVQRQDVRARDAAVARCRRRWRPSARRAAPLCARMVEQSSSACVGCSCVPSPALMTRGAMLLGEHVGGARLARGARRPRRAPSPRGSARCRAASRPCVVDDAEPEMLTASADSRLAAISNDVRVRVDGSKNRLITVLPRSVGTFLIGRSAISTKRSPRSRIGARCSAVDSGSMPSRWR